MADPFIGTTVAQYEVVAKLGGGGMGVVYKARDTKLGRFVALKFLPPQWSHDENAKQRFIREAQAASATDHRNICTIHNIESTADGQLFIVMAFYEGQTLKQKLDAGPLRVDEAVEIAAQVAEGLARAHGQGVVHRDIKPGNLMLTDDTVKILDFGLAKFADVRFKLTLEGSTLGTVAYMSPEQARGEEADERSDIWATGVVLYEMLSGDPPFRGGYPESISHAIRNDSPRSLRTSDRDISEALEQLVFRALHKEAGVRFQSARDLVRALRLQQGQSLPIDLRTEPLPAIDHERRTAATRRTWGSRRAGMAGAVTVAALVGAPLWIFLPVDRIPVAVAPVVNQTGYAELDPYRLALTGELTAQLAESRGIRVLPYERLLQIIRHDRLDGADVSSRETIQAITTHSGARVLIIPTVLYEDGAWKARVEFRNADTAVSEASRETPSSVSSLMKDAVYGLMAPLAAATEEHFVTTGPRRAYLASTLRRRIGRAPAPATPRFRSLEAARTFEEGLNWYDELEYAAARTRFASVAEQDPQNPLPVAWWSRAARVMREDDDAADAAARAARLVTEQTPEPDALFVNAVVAETRHDLAGAEMRYRALIARHADEPAWVMELAAFQDRQGQNEPAIASYHNALRLDGRLERAHVELCRLYNRLNESARARDEGQRALLGYRNAGDRGGEAQALLCLADTLRVGNQEERQQAARHSAEALKAFESLGHSYNLARAHNYAALSAAAQGQMVEAAAAWESALHTARATQNKGLEALVLMNLGVAHTRLGSRSRAVEYRIQSYKLFEALGDEQRAAENQANGAELFIEFGPDPEQGLRDAQNALAVFRKLGNRNFEVYCHRVIAAANRYAGRHVDAERELNRALAIARERNLADDIAPLTIELARTQFDRNDYVGARDLLLKATQLAPDNVPARIRLGLVLTRLGDFNGAGSSFTQVSGALQARPNRNHTALLHSGMGELAYESGRNDEARTHFAAGSALWTDTLPDAASVEARAFLGLLEALDGRTAIGRTALQSSLDQAKKMGRLALEARCRVHLARVDLLAGRPDGALAVLRDVGPDAEQSIGPELQAQVHYWRSEAFRARGDAITAHAQAQTARQILEGVRQSVPEPMRGRFVRRTDIQRVIG